MKGINNLGNTCYFSSILQCLLQIPQLSNYFLLKKYEGNCEFTREYQICVHTIWKHKETFNPHNLLTIFKKKYTQFDNRGQHDSQEAFLCIIDILEKSLSDFIKKLFYGENTQETICKSGKSIKKENFNIIILFPNKEQTHINDLLKKSQKWNGIKDYEDNNGKMWNAAATRTIASELPYILVISFRMYERKIKIQLEEDIDFCGTQYTLFATSNHQGSTPNGGHYIAFTKHKNIWYLKDDEMCKQHDFPLVEYHYLSFYKKR
jgi:ubiquitin C-terminal hydrolase